MDIAEIRLALQDMHIATVAKDTRLSRQTVYNARNDKCALPTPATSKLLADYITLYRKRLAAKAKVRGDAA